jgi:hypothetical protein
LSSFDKSYEALRDNPSLNWDGFGNEQAWLQHQSKKVYGYVGFLKGELTNPNSQIKLHGRDNTVTDLTSGETWAAFDRQHFDGSNLEFGEAVKTHGGYQIGASGSYYLPNGSTTGSLGGGLTLLDASHGTNSAFDTSHVRSTSDVTNALQNGPLNIDPAAPNAFGRYGATLIDGFIKNGFSERKVKVA